MSAPLIGVSLHIFLVLLILSAIAAAVVHWALRYRLFNGIDGFLGQWMGRCCADPELARTILNGRDHHRPIRYEAGLPSSVNRFRMLQARADSVC
jgi:hypothetical protein